MAITTFTTFGQILSALCKAEDKYGMFCSVTTSEEEFCSPEGLLDAAPWLTPDDLMSLWFSAAGYFLSDTKQEMLDAYWQTVGDDGPTDTNPYHGPVRVYALTCSPKGELLNENT